MLANAVTALDLHAGAASRVRGGATTPIRAVITDRRQGPAPLPPGQRHDRLVTIYTRTDLVAADPETSQGGDRVTRGAEDYRVIQVIPRPEGGYFEAVGALNMTAGVRVEIGPFVETVDLQRAVTTLDAAKRQVASWTTYAAAIPARVTIGKATEDPNSAADTDPASDEVALITIAWRADTGVGDWVMWGARRYYVERVRNPDEQRRWLLMACRERGL
jgi:head-tail adaptor